MTLNLFRAYRNVRDRVRKNREEHGVIRAAAARERARVTVSFKADRPDYSEVMFASEYYPTWGYIKAVRMGQNRAEQFLRDGVWLRNHQPLVLVPPHEIAAIDVRSYDEAAD